MFHGQSNLPNICLDERVMDIDRRIREGDEVWRGSTPEEQHTLTWNPENQKFEVLAQDGHRNWYVCLQSDTCDPSILIELARTDWRRGAAVFAEFKAAEAKKIQLRKDVEKDAQGERIEKFKYDLTHALGEKTMFGGLNRPYEKAS